LPLHRVLPIDLSKGCWERGELNLQARELFGFIFRVGVAPRKANALIKREMKGGGLEKRAR